VLPLSVVKHLYIIEERKSNLLLINELGKLSTATEQIGSCKSAKKYCSLDRCNQRSSNGPYGDISFFRVPKRRHTLNDREAPSVDEYRYLVNEKCPETQAVSTRNLPSNITNPAKIPKNSMVSLMLKITSPKVDMTTINNKSCLINKVSELFTGVRQKK
jgi:hypothetical protein